MKATSLLLAALIMQAAVCWPEFEVEELEGITRINENRRSVLDFAFERNSKNDIEGIGIRRLCDPYGDPYLGAGAVPPDAAALDWGVERCWLGDRILEPFRLNGGGRCFERIEFLTIGDSAIEVTFQQAWLDEDGVAFVLETTSLLIHAERYRRRAIDLKFRLINVADKAVGLETSVRAENVRLAVRFDPHRDGLSFRDVSHNSVPAPVEYAGSWLAMLSRSPTRMRPVGFALFKNGEPPGSAAGVLSASPRGVLAFAPNLGADTILEPGQSVEWTARLYCFVDDLPAKEIEAAYRRYLGGDTW